MLERLFLKELKEPARSTAARHVSPRLGGEPRVAGGRQINAANLRIFRLIRVGGDEPAWANTTAGSS